MVCHCTAGYRSGFAAAKLEKQLECNVWNLHCGIIQWANDGGKIVKPDGTPARQVNTFNDIKNDTILANMRVTIGDERKATNLLRYIGIDAITDTANPIKDIYTMRELAGYKAWARQRTTAGAQPVDTAIDD